MTAPHGWDDCPADARTLVLAAVDAARVRLVHDLVGCYLHGSLAAGSWYPPKSDFDLLVVTRGPLTPERRRALLADWLALSDARTNTGDLEISVILARHARAFRHPLPFEAHFGENVTDAIRAGEVPWSPGATDPDLAAHITVTRARGIALTGPPSADVFAPVPRDAFRAAILADLDWILEGENILVSPFYSVLNACRIVRAFREDNRTSTKDEAGEWALHTLPDEHHAIVRAALAAYRSTAPVPAARRRTAGLAWDGQGLVRFRDWVDAFARRHGFRYQ